MSTDPSLSRELLVLLNTATGSATARVDSALRMLLESLGMEVAFVGEFHDGARVITALASVEGLEAAAFPAVGSAHPLEETFCALVANGTVSTLIPDVAADGDLAHRLPFSIGAHAGVALELDGRLLGTVCAASSSPQLSLNQRDAATLRTVAHYIAGVRREELALRMEAEPAASPSRQPAPPTSAPLSLLGAAAALSGGQTLEALARPMLELLRQVTGLESTYLTVIDWERDRWKIAYVLNGGDLQLPEGLEVPWSDSLCRRALDQNVPFTNQVPTLWGDYEAARELSIVTYVSVPVHDSHGGVVGTLCGASRRSLDLPGEDLAALDLFAKLVGGQLEREAAHAETTARAELLEARTRELGTLAMRDPLTGLANRAGICAWLDTVLSSLRPDLEQLAVAFIDIDDFKTVNDTLGHAAGDEALRRFSGSLQQVGRPGDLHGRLGGDELVVAAVLATGSAVLGGWTGRLQRAARIDLEGQVVTASVGVATCSEPDTAAAEILIRADEAMYAAKRSRRAAA